MRAPARTMSLVFALLSLSTTASAQGDRVNLLAQLDDYGSYSDIWGYQSGGREVAILGISNGTAFYDCTDPKNPFFLKFISRSSSTWADMKTLGTWCYVVTEGGGGMQIIDMSDLDDIKLDSTYSGFSTAHNIYIDTAAKTCYLPGANNGMPILDLTKRRNPVEIARYTNYYVHDMQAQNGLAHLGEIYDGRYRILDVSNLPSMPSLDSIVTPGQFTHNTWATADDSVVVTTDESGGGHLAIYDVSNPNNIQLLSEYTENSSGIIHNAIIHNSVVHMSYYAEGYVAVDISDPTKPTKLGSYDTYSGSSGDYDGAWGVYPFQPSGVVYVSDIGTGLYLLARAMDISHTDLQDTVDTTGPYTAVASIVSSSLNQADLHYSVDDGSNWTTVTMVPTGNPDEYAADIPGMPAGTTVHYWLEAADDSSSGIYPNSPGDLVVFSVGDRTQLYLNDFESSGDQGWTHGQKQTQDDWQHGVPQGKAGDPNSAYSGTRCWANDLGGSGYNGAYQNDVDNWLLSPVIDCSNATGTRLRIERWLTIEDANNDIARIRVNDQQVWKNPITADLRDTGWVTLDIDISAEADGVANTQVRFVLKSDSTDVFGGWNIDDFEVYTVSDCDDEEHYGYGFAGSGGFVPTINTVGTPSVGNSSFKIEGHEFLGRTQTYLFLGFGRAQIPFKDIDIWVDLGQYFFLFPLKADGSKDVPGDGDVSFPAGIPNNPNGVGIEIDAQFLSVDPAGSKGFAGTDGMAFVICEG